MESAYRYDCEFFTIGSHKGPTAPIVAPRPRAESKGAMMKAERRHELRENELSHVMEQVRQFLGGHARMITTTIAGAAVVFLLVTFAVRQRNVGIEDQWRLFSQLRFDDATKVKETMQTLDALVSKAKSDDFLLTALASQGRQSLKLAQNVGGFPDREMNNKAKSAFEQMLRRFPENPLAFGIAHLGLATAEENSFVLSNDPASSARAKEHLSTIITNPTMVNFPFLLMATDRRNALEETFTQVSFAPPSLDAPPPSPAPQMSPEARANLPPELRKVMEDSAGGLKFNVFEGVPEGEQPPAIPANEEEGVDRADDQDAPKKP